MMAPASATAAGPAAVARAIGQARKHHQPSDAAALAGALQTLDEAYLAQAMVAEAMHGHAADVAFARFWKSGGPSREAVQTHAALPPEGVWASPADARTWPFTLRLIEVEIALRLAREVTPAEAAALTPAAAEALVDAMAVSIEIVDSRWVQGVDAPALLKLADLQSHGALVLGAWMPYAPRHWAAQTCSVTIGAQAPVEWRGSHSMGDPVWVLPGWLRHATREGRSVPGASVVTTGTWCGMLLASPGDLVTARFAGIGEAAVQL
jgi:2-keto-4-pentenoate hydratase